MTKQNQSCYTSGPSGKGKVSLEKTVMLGKIEGLEKRKAKYVLC